MKIPIGSQIKMIRARHDFSLQDLGRISGVHYSHISNIENSLYPPRPDQLAAIEAALGISFSDPQVQAAFLILAGNAYGPDASAGNNHQQEDSNAQQ